MNKKLVPKLRFSEFSGDWKIKQLEQLADITTGTKDTQNKVDDGKYPFFVRSQTIENINSYSYDGEAILTSGDGVGVGKNFHYINGKFDYHQRVYCIYNFKAEISGKYIYLYFSEHFNRRIMRMSAKNSVDSVRRDMVTNMQITIPFLPEQTKIANFITAVDDKIQQLTKKKQLFEQYKKGLMQQIFSQKIRFKDDNGNDYPDWQNLKLDTVFFHEKGTGLSKSALVYNGVYECILYGELYTTYNEVIHGVRSKTNEKSESMSKVGDLLIPSSTTTTGIDLANVTALNKNGVLIGGDITILRSHFNYETNNIFYAYYLSHFKKQEIADYAQGSTIIHLYFNHIKGMNIDLPLLEEQTKIADFLTTIDDKITYANTQLEQTKLFKKSLLQQMLALS